MEQATETMASQAAAAPQEQPVPQPVPAPETPQEPHTEEQTEQAASAPEKVRSRYHAVVSLKRGNELGVGFIEARTRVELRKKALELPEAKVLAIFRGKKVPFQEKRAISF